MKLNLHRHILLLTFIGATLSLFSQAGANEFLHRRANNWMFGDKHKLDFNCNPPRYTREAKIDTASYSMGTISDRCGEPQFYANGDSIWMYNHNSIAHPTIPMLGNRKSIQSTIILPKPQDDFTFYFFNMDNDGGQNLNGLTYVTVTGGHIVPNVATGNLFLANMTDDVIASIDDGTGGYWVVVKMKGLAEFRAFHVTATGVDVNPMISMTPKMLATTIKGEMKFSPDGRFLAVSNPLQIFKFDKVTGEISDFVDNNSIPLTYPTNGHSIAWSPGSKMLYVATGMLYQYDFTYNDPDSIKFTRQNIFTAPSVLGGIQTGPDGRIYLIDDPKSPNLSVILYPDTKSHLCEYVKNQVKLSGPAGKALPNFPSNWVESVPFRASQFCTFDTTTFDMVPTYWEDLVSIGFIDSVKWTFYDSAGLPAGISKQQTAKYTYNKVGCFKVQLDVYSGKKGNFQREELITVSPRPTLAIGPRDTALCSRPRKIFLNASSANNPNSEYVWYHSTFADTGKNLDPLVFGNISFIEPQIEGRFWVKKNYRCCTYFDTIDIHHDSITPFFRVDDGVQCEQTNDFQFTNTSVPVFKQTDWDMGDGNKVIGADILKYHYKNVGTYNPKMTAISPNGCSATLSRLILVVKHPEARFFVDTSQLCLEGNKFNIRDSSTIEFGHGGLTGWEFDLGDSVTKLKKFTKTYATAGVKNIRLIVNSSQDCKDTAWATLRLYDPPKAGFTINDTDQCLSANKFVITDTTYSGLDPINFSSWEYGDGSPPEDRKGLPLQFNRSYTTVDSFLIKMKVGTGIGCFDSAQKRVWVRGDPYVDFTNDSAEQCLLGNKYNFRDTVHTVKGYVQQWLWDFGDGTKGSSGLDKSYTNFGDYDVKLKVITNQGCADSVIKQVQVDAMPVAAFTVNKNIACFKDHVFVFSATPSNIARGSIAVYDWDFGDGTNDGMKEPMPKVYTNDTTHTVRLALLSDRGCADTTTQTIRFFATPVAVAGVKLPASQCLQDNRFYFSGEKSTAKGGAIKEFLWEYGDGTINSGMVPQAKVYSYSDTFDVQLRITTTNGCWDTSTTQVVVLPSPAANFSVDPTCLFQPSRFRNKSYTNPGKITEWQWDLGDGTLSNDSAPEHTYDNTGSYTVSLKVKSDFGCDAAITKVNEALVKPLPQAHFSFEKSDFDNKTTTIKYFDSSIDASYWFWNLGKGFVSTDQNPIQVYDDTATIPIMLVIGNTQGCFDTMRREIFVAPDFMFYVPNAFTPNEDEKNPTFGGEGTLYFKEYDLKVFNRWGQMVFHSQSPLNKWDGTHKGEECPIGAYTYIYRLRDVFGYYHNYSGVINLIR